MAHQSELIAQDILAYLQSHEQKDLLRFITCGNVDDGKSTLIGRLLHDSKSIFEDQLAAIQKDSQKYNTTDTDMDLALLVDGLAAEREQGITIDVAYRYFSTERRKFIIADCPGHEQYTRNMATGASNSDLAIILIDARYGVQTQTKRHSYIVSLLGIQHVIVAINKMDLVGYDQARFEEIRLAYLALAESLNIPDIRFIPISALRGDQVVSTGSHMPWYQGNTLLATLESIQINQDTHLEGFRLPVQYVNRPDSSFRGFSGTVAAGSLKVGDSIQVLPSGKTSTVEALFNADDSVAGVGRQAAVTVQLSTEVDVSRGDMLVKPEETSPLIASELRVQLVWMDDTPLSIGKTYWFKLAGKKVSGTVSAIRHKVNINTLQSYQNEDALKLNEIAEVDIVLLSPVVVDRYQDCRQTGSLIVIDKLTHQTSGAGMVLGKAEVLLQEDSSLEAKLAHYQAFERELHDLVKRYFPHWEVKDILK